MLYFMTDTKAKGTQYIVENIQKAKEMGYPGTEIYNDEDYGWGIWYIEDNKVVEFIGSDGGEPEDQLLVRNWKWVVNALNEAYEKGYKDGQFDSYERYSP
mgnify:FL=1